MPTPFYHLWIAQDLLSHPGLARKTQRLLERNRAAFLFGNTAPDVQVLSGQSRQATHHFPFPVPAGHPSPVQGMLSSYPEIANPQRLPEAHAAFISGYLCHLLADWTWVLELYSPIFGPGACWGEISDCVYIHNVLRAYLDRKVLTILAKDAGDSLQRAEPRGWLPYTDDRYLCKWRDFLAGQLRSPAAVQTVEVFAARQGLSVESFYRLLDSEERMEQEVFVHLSYPQIEAYRARLLTESVQLLSRYLDRPETGVFQQASAGVVMQ